MTNHHPIAVVTGASAGIGAATAEQLSNAGFHVIMGARTLDRLEKIAAALRATAIALDVTDTASVEAFCAQVPSCAVLVNNAGGAIGLDPVASANDADWLEMYQRNVMSILRMTRALLPKLIASGDGRIINIGSTASHLTYPGGGGYTAAKHGERAVTRTLRMELMGQPVRVTSVDPGMVETEFSIARFGGDIEKAAEVYKGMNPLTAADVAECITWIATRPAHVNIDELIVTPRDQVMGHGVHRRQ